MHVNSVNSSSVTGIHSIYFLNVEVKVYDKQPRDNNLLDLSDDYI